jgi:hypothetical protein
MGQRATPGDEKRLLFSSYSPRKRDPSLCHLDRSEAQWRDLYVDALSWKCFLTERGVAEGPAVVSPCQPAPQVKPSLWVGKSWMTISRSPFSLDCAGALSLERSIGGFALAPVGLGKQAVGLDERGVSLNSGIEL